MNEARLEASKVAVTAAKERLRGEEARFEVGLGTTRELIEAQRDLLQTISVQVRAEMDLRKSHAQLDKATGRTFEHQNIVLLDALETNVKRLRP
jgi:outer membrane protein TolC